MNTRRQDLTVASGATVSTHFVGSGFSAFGLITPAGMEGTVVTFEVGYYNSGTITWTPLNNLATAAFLTVAASKAYKLPDDLRPFSEWRLLTAAQTGAAVFVVFGKSGA
jgi:hypothetical protein